MKLHEVFGNVNNPTVYKNLSNDEILFEKGYYGYEKFRKRIGVGAGCLNTNVKIMPVTNFYNILIELGMARSIESARNMTNRLERADYLHNTDRDTSLTITTVNEGRDIRVSEKYQLHMGM